MLASELDTPALVVDLDVMDENIRRMQEYFDSHSLNLRAHIKAHKVPAIAWKQMRAGAIGIVCQKLGEAEVMAAAGIEDILIPYNIVGEQKLERLMRLVKQATITVAVDSEYTARGISRKAQEKGCCVNVIVELDTGGKRTGVQSPEEALALGKKILCMPNLSFQGFMTHPSTLESNPFLKKTLKLFEQESIPVAMVSGGSTSTAYIAHKIYGLTEHRAGHYPFYCYFHVLIGDCTLDQCALSVLVTVVSRPTPDRAIIDAGAKTLGRLPLPAGDGLGFGYVKEYPEARIFELSEEHGHVDVSACEKKPAIGERLTVIPNHCCDTVNLNDQLIGIRRGEVEVVWPILARGKTR